jgi:hypothetical protein
VGNVSDQEGDLENMESDMMDDTSDDYAAIEAFMHSIGDYVVLRNHDFRANLGRGGDVDVLVGDMRKARKAMKQVLGSPWWIMRRSYVEGCFYPWGHIDLTPRMEWHGATYIENRTIFDASSISPFGLRQPRLAHEAIICWFASLIWGGFFKERYAPVIEMAAQSDGDAFRSALIHAVGRSWGEKLFDLARNGASESSAAWVAQLRRSLWIQGFRRQPLKTMIRWYKYCTHEIRLRTSPPVPWIALISPHESLKSTLLSAFQTEWTNSGLKARIFRWCPGVFKTAAAIAGTTFNCHGSKPRHSIHSVAQLVTLWLDWFIGLHFKIADQRARGVFAIFDRSHLDLLVEPSRYHCGAPTWLARLFLRMLPQPDAVVLLDASPDDVLATEHEPDLKEARKMREKFLEVVRGLPNGHIVDCSVPVETAARTLIHLLLDITKQRENAKRNL